MIRLAIYLLSKRWGLIIVGAILVLSGLIYGISSHTVTYQSLKQQTIVHYLSGGGDNKGYMELQGSSTLYIVNESDFTPALSANAFNANNNVIDLVYRPDQTTDINANANNTNTHLTGPAYTVEQITVYDTNGQNPHTFSSSEELQNPNGFYQNNWLGGIAIFLLGAVLLALVFFWPAIRARRKGQAAPSVIPGQPNQYAQPYTNPAQYPYPQQPPQYQPQQQYPQYAPPSEQHPQYPSYPAPQQPQQPQYPAYPPQAGQFERTQLANPNDYPPQNR